MISSGPRSRDTWRESRRSGRGCTTRATSISENTRDFTARNARRSGPSHSSLTDAALTAADLSQRRARRLTSSECQSMPTSFLSSSEKTLTSSFLNRDAMRWWRSWSRAWKTSAYPVHRSTGAFRCLTILNTSCTYGSTRSQTM